MKWLLTYKDPKKKRLQQIEIAIMILVLPIGLFYGAKAFQEWQIFQAAEALYAQAAEHTHSGNYKESISILEEAVAIYPTHYSAWEDLGVGYHMMGEREKSVDAYRRGVEALPENGNLRRELATAYHNLGEHELELIEAEIAEALVNSDPLFTMKVADRARKEASGEVEKSTPAGRLPAMLEAPDVDHAGHDHSHEDDHEGHDH